MFSEHVVDMLKAGTPVEVVIQIIKNYTAEDKINHYAYKCRSTKNVNELFPAVHVQLERVFFN